MRWMMPGLSTHGELRVAVIDYLRLTQLSNGSVQAGTIGSFVLTSATLVYSIVLGGQPED